VLFRRKERLFGIDIVLQIAGIMPEKKHSGNIHEYGASHNTETKSRQRRIYRPEIQGTAQSSGSEKGGTDHCIPVIGKVEKYHENAVGGCKNTVTYTKGAEESPGCRIKTCKTGFAQNGGTYGAHEQGDYELLKNQVEEFTFENGEHIPFCELNRLEGPVRVKKSEVTFVSRIEKHFRGG